MGTQPPKNLIVFLLQVNEREDLVADVGQSVPFGLSLRSPAAILGNFMLLSIRLIALAGLALF